MKLLNSNREMTIGDGPESWHSDKERFLTFSHKAIWTVQFEFSATICLTFLLLKFNLKAAFFIYFSLFHSQNPRHLLNFQVHDLHPISLPPLKKKKEDLIVRIDQHGQKAKKERKIKWKKVSDK